MRVHCDQTKVTNPVACPANGFDRHAGTRHYPRYSGGSRNLLHAFELTRMEKRQPWRLIGTVACSAALAWFVTVPESAARPSDTGWTIFGNDRGTTVQYPRDLFPTEAGQGNPGGQVFSTVDGRARLHIFALRNERNESPARFLRRAFTENRQRLTYDRVAGNFFAVSAPDKGRILYRRCNFSGDIIHCVDIQYPRSEKRAWDGVVTRISLSLRPR